MMMKPQPFKSLPGFRAVPLGHRLARLLARLLAGLLAAVLCVAAWAIASDGVTLVALFPGKAIIVIRGAAPRTMSVGDEVDGVKLLSTTRTTATLLIDGDRQVLQVSDYYGSGTGKPVSQSVTLYPDSKGRIAGRAIINGLPVQFIVDTGAAMTIISTGEAKRLGIKPPPSSAPAGNPAAGGPAADSGTPAAGPPAAGTPGATAPTSFIVHLDHIKVGDVDLPNLEVQIQPGNDGEAMVLGKNFLNHTDVKSEGGNMVLTRRF